MCLSIKIEGSKLDLIKYHTFEKFLSHWQILSMTLDSHHFTIFRISTGHPFLAGWCRLSPHPATFFLLRNRSKGLMITGHPYNGPLKWNSISLHHSPMTVMPSFQLCQLHSLIPWWQEEALDGPLEHHYSLISILLTCYHHQENRVKVGEYLVHGAGSLSHLTKRYLQTLKP